jgi:hypothetical protein
MNRNYHKSWPEEAIAEFEKGIAAHGGWTAWDKFTAINLKIKEFRGMLVFTKGLGKTFFAPNLLKIDPKKRVVEFEYGTHTDRFENGRLIFSPQKQVIENGRTLFSRGIFEKWHPQHALYFFGYAWSNYIGYPFILPEFELLDWKTGVFKIRFPNSFHTHSNVQTFYFDSQHLLSRHDYVAEVAGSIFHGAHFTEGYEDHAGIKIACLRKIRAIVMGVVTPLYGIYARMEIAAR